MSTKALEMAYGRKIDVGMSIRSQEDLPDWHALPPETRAALETVFAEGVWTPPPAGP